jgi:uncharacterized protein (DUF1778 family)
MRNAMPTTPARAPKTKRLNFRISGSQEELLRRGASVAGKSVTDFIIESACAVAECELAEQSEFRLPPDQWRAFLAELDKPPALKPALRRLLNEPSVIELANRQE